MDFLFPGSCFFEEEKMYAAGIDLGTTTISGVVIDLEKRELKKHILRKAKAL